MGPARIIICFLLLATLSGRPAAAATAVFVQGVCDARGVNTSYATDGVTLLTNTTPGPDLSSGNWGALDTLSLGHGNSISYRPLIRFDLSSLAGRALTIRRARLILTVNQTQLTGFVSRLPSPTTIALYRLTPANAGWIEGTSSAGAAEPGAACWAYWAWSASGERPWAGGPGCGVAGVDYETSPAAVASRSEGFWARGEQWVFEIEAPGELAAWIDQPASNSGWVLRAPDLENANPDVLVSCLRFWSDDAADPGVRPRLEIQYDPMPDMNIHEATLLDGPTAGLTDVMTVASMAISLFSGLDGSYGGAPTVAVGIEPQGESSQRWRSLFKFDLSGLQGHNAEILAAEFCLTPAGAEGMGDLSALAPQTLAIYRLQPADAAWCEGLASGGYSEVGAATWGWLARDLYRWSGGNPDGAGAGLAGVDYDPVALAILARCPEELTTDQALSWRMLDTAALAEWIEHPRRNAGFKLESPSLEALGTTQSETRAHLTFYSDDAATTTLRPRLVLTWREAASRSSARPVWLSAR
jgi:hypothetical protein